MHRAAIYSAFKQSPRSSSCWGSKFPPKSIYFLETRSSQVSVSSSWVPGFERSYCSTNPFLPPPSLHLQVGPPLKLGARFCEGKLWNSDNMTIWPLAACESHSCNCITPMSDHCWKLLQFLCKVILSFFHSFHCYPWPDLSKKRSTLFTFFSVCNRD